MSLGRLVGALPGGGRFITGLVSCALALALVAPLSGFAKTKRTGEKGFWGKLRAVFDEKEEEIPPVEDLFEEAEQYYNGHETWYGAMVRRTWGEDSKAYELPGVVMNNYTKALERYRMVVDNYPFSSQAVIAELRVADCHYKLEQYPEAVVWYEQFTKRHPKHEEVPYATYYQGMCYYEQKLKPGRDQDNARQAVKTFTYLIDTYPSTEYAGEAEPKLADSRKTLAEHELLIADFYFRKGDFWAAAARYRGVYLDLSGAGFDARAMFQEGECYKGLGKAGLARDMYAEVINYHADSEYAEKAKAERAELEKEEAPK